MTQPHRFIYIVKAMLHLTKSSTISSTILWRCALFATVKSIVDDFIVDDIVKCGIAFMLVGPTVMRTNPNCIHLLEHSTKALTNQLNEEPVFHYNPIPLITLTPIVTSLRNFFYACSGQWQFSTAWFGGFGYWLGLVFTIIVSLTLTLTLATLSLLLL